MCDSARWSVSFHHLARVRAFTWWGEHSSPSFTCGVCECINQSERLTSFIHTSKHIRTHVHLHAAQTPQACKRHLFAFHVRGSPSFLRFICAISLLCLVVACSAVYLLTSMPTSSLSFLSLSRFSHAIRISDDKSISNSHLRSFRSSFSCLFLFLQPES